MSEQKSTFSILNAVNVNDKTEKKETLTYLSWAWAWTEVKKQFPDATYEVVKFGNIPYVYDPLTGYMVYTTVTINGLTHEMWLPVMNGANKAMFAQPYTYPATVWKNNQKVQVTKTVEMATMTDINKTIMRCLTKNLAMHGLGLYIYAGEDIPDAPGDETDSTQAYPDIDKIERPKPTSLKEKPVKKVDMPPPTPQDTQQTQKEPQKQEPAQQPAQPAPEEKKQVQPASTAKAPIVIQELVIGSENWKRVLGYISANKALGYTKIIEALSTKYTMGPGIKKQLKMEIEK